MQEPTAALAKATMSGTLPPAGGAVRSFVREWRAGADDDEHYVYAIAL